MNSGTLKQAILFSFFYFLEGIPYGIQSDTLPIIYRSSMSLSLSLTTFSKISLIPWLLKPFLASKFQSINSNKILVKCSLAIAVVVCLLAALFHQNSYKNLLVIQFFLHSAIAAMDIGVDYLQISDETVANDVKSFGLFKSIEVCFYKFGAFVAGALFLRFSAGGETHLDLLYGLAGLLYAVGFMVALLCFQTGGRIDQNHTNTEEENRKPVKILKHAKICGFLLTQKLFGTAFRTLLPLYILDHGILRKEHIAAYTGTLPLIAGTFGSAFGGMIPTLFQTTKSEISVKSLLYGQTVCFTIASMPSYVVFSGHVSNSDSFMLFTSVLITVLSFLGGAQTTLVFVRMAEIVKENEFKENRNQLYCWLCSVEIIGKLVCGIIIGSVAEVLGYSSSILLCLGFQFLTVFMV